MRLVEFASAADALELWKLISDNTWMALMQAIESDEENDSNPTSASSQAIRPPAPTYPVQSITPVSPSRKGTTHKKVPKAKARKAVPKPIPLSPKPLPVTKAAVPRQSNKPQPSKSPPPAKPVLYPKEQGSKINSNLVANQKQPDPFQSDEKRSPAQVDALYGAVRR